MTTYTLFALNDFALFQAVEVSSAKTPRSMTACHRDFENLIVGLLNQQVSVKMDPASFTDDQNSKRQLRSALSAQLSQRSAVVFYRYIC